MEKKMPIADKEFFIAHYNEVKNILNNCGVTRCGLNFEPNKTQVLLEFKDKKIFYKVEEALMNLCNQCETAYTVSLSAFSAKGQPLLSSKTLMTSKLLKQSIQIVQFLHLEMHRSVWLRLISPGLRVAIK